ncbi:uncharacterized protein BN463_00652 [Methanoculleus sp. CAG:1088]|nr:uncharacterized protein BN463_00652 [Methanoculleus sp. CAG:1088]
MRMNNYQAEAIMRELSTIKEKSEFYRKKFADIDLSKIRTQEDFETLPFTDKGDLREAYPLGLAAVPEKDIVRIHSSSGTTGTPTPLIGYLRHPRGHPLHEEGCRGLGHDVREML